MKLEQWKKVETELDANVFAKLLTTLKETPDYQNASSRPLLRKRVLTLLEPMLEDRELRAKCFFLAEKATNSCHDNVALGLNHLDTGVLDYRATRGEFDEPALWELGCGMFRLAQLEKIALKIKKMQSLNDVDAIEVLLAYQVGLREKLGLPVQTHQMLFRTFSGVTDEDLALAELEIKKAEASEQLGDFLASWGPWQEHIKRAYGQEIEDESVMKSEFLETEE